VSISDVTRLAAVIQTVIFNTLKYIAAGILLLFVDLFNDGFSTA
jgi:hypothetical protein